MLSGAPGDLVLYNGPLYDTPGGSDLAAIRGAAKKARKRKTDGPETVKRGRGGGDRKAEVSFLEAPLEMPDAPGTVTMREAP